MGMRSVSSTSGANQSGGAAWQQRQQGLQALAKAVQSGDLDAAKAAFANLAKNAPVHSNANANANASSPLAQIGQALQGGDLTGAQKIMATMYSRGGRDRVADAPASNAMVPSAPTASSGNFVNVMV